MSPLVRQGLRPLLPLHILVALLLLVQHIKLASAFDLTLAPYSLPSPPTPVPAAPSEAPSVETPSLSLLPTTAPSNAPTGKSTLENLTWASIRVTFIASVVFFILLTFVFEIARRSKVLDEVFDRKRETRPDRTPPKLITSSGGWFGWIWYVGEYFYVDGYVYPEYAMYAQRLQEQKEEEEKAMKNSSSTHKNVETKSPESIATGTIPEQETKDEEVPPMAEEADVTKEDAAAVDVTSSTDLPQVSTTLSLTQKPPSRWHYVFVRPGSSIGSLYNCLNRKKHGPQSPRYFRKLTDEGGGWRQSQAEGSGENDKKSSLLVRLQRFIPVLNPLSPPDSDRELLRCIGLDSYTMIRFLRLGFEMTFFPFLAACVTLIPTYYTNDYEGEFGQVAAPDESTFGFSTTTTQGYFSITINRLENGSNKLIVVWLYAIFYYLIILRRLWVEWKVFVELREDFLANGDPSAIKEDDAESLKQFRNACIVENVPSSHRRDKDMFVFYNSLFPGQVRRAEIIVNSSKLTELIQERQRYIEQYESIEAKQVHKERKYDRNVKLFEDGKHNGLGCARRKPKQPKEIEIKVGGGICSSGRVLTGDSALEYYMKEIRTMNAKIDDEYASLVRRKQESDRVPSLLEAKKAESSERTENSGIISHLESLLLNDNGNREDHQEALIDCGNGFVEFKTRSAKQAALQMNLTGLSSYFSTEQAPDPRDIIWKNMPASRGIISRSKLAIQLFLSVGILFWSALTGLIGSIESAVNEWAVQNNVTAVALTGFIAGYIPVLLLLTLMALLPMIFEALAIHVIRFRTHSESNKFVLKWNYLYRIANFAVILVAGTLYNTLLDVRTNPEKVVESIANGVLIQSQFFFNLVLTTIGTGTSLQISQLWSVLYWLIVKGIIREEAMSERKLQQLRVPKEYFFSYFTAEHMYILMIAMVYSAMVPIIMGACSLYFFVASKIYTHQALYVFSQKYEGGGKVFYSINRTMLVLIYVSIIIFSVIMLLKERPILSGIFLLGMTGITILVDNAIDKRFSQMSKKLPLTRARIIDEEYNSVLQNEGSILIDETASPLRSSDQSETQTLDIPSSFVGMDRRKMLVKRATAYRNYNTSVGMGIGLPGLGGDDEEAKLDFFLYRQPDLHRRTWEIEPRPYRLDEES